jgi:hypothetical protein
VELSTIVRFLSCMLCCLFFVVDNLVSQCLESWNLHIRLCFCSFLRLLPLVTFLILHSRHSCHVAWNSIQYVPYVLFNVPMSFLCTEYWFNSFKPLFCTSTTSGILAPDTFCSLLLIFVNFSWEYWFESVMSFVEGCFDDIVVAH